MPDASAWVQAGASIVLIGITWRYVVLTARMSRSAADQAKLLDDQRRLDRELRLSAVFLSVVRLKSALESLPGPESEARADRMLRQAAIWTPSELDSFASNSARLGSEVAAIAAAVVDNLSWLGDRVRDVRAVSTNTGFDYSRFAWGEWHTRASNAQNGLARIEAAVRDAHALGR